METVGPPQADAELDLLKRWSDPSSDARTRKARALSVLVHVVAIAGLLLLPSDFFDPPKRQPIPEVTRRVTPLIAPPTEFTQKRPNEGKLSKEIDIASLQPQEKIQTPKSA